MQTLKENQEEVFICCWCSEEFPSLKAYVKHAIEKMRKGNPNHDNWFSMFRDKKEGVVNANL